MTYHAGMHVPGWAQEPHIHCDGCNLVRSVTRANGMPYAWLMNGKAAPGWRMERDSAGIRRDYCPKCKEAP